MIDATQTSSVIVHTMGTVKMHSHVKDSTEHGYQPGYQKKILILTSAQATRNLAFVTDGNEAERHMLHHDLT